MKSIDNIRNGLIDKLLTIQSKDFLLAIDQLLSAAKSEEELIHITEDQKKMLDMSHQDIQNNNLLPEDELNLRAQWQ